MAFRTLNLFIPKHDILYMGVSLSQNRRIIARKPASGTIAKKPTSHNKEPTLEQKMAIHRARSVWHQETLLERNALFNELFRERLKQREDRERIDAHIAELAQPTIRITAGNYWDKVNGRLGKTVP